MAPGLRRAAFLAIAAGALLFTGCASCQRSGGEKFVVGRDSFAYPNELLRTYTFHADGRTTSHQTDPKPDYALHCFSMVRAAREFFYHARFDAGLPRLADAEYGRRVKAVVARDSRCPSEDRERIVIPGYGDFHAFSSDFEELLKRECGGAWQSYAQRGNWRMVFPFSRRSQERTAQELEKELGEGRAPILHLVDFPKLKLNHAVLVTGVRKNGENLEFEVYDPNETSRAATLLFDGERRTFVFEQNKYFRGGGVNAYEVYKGALY